MNKTIKILIEFRSINYGSSGGIENYAYYFMDSIVSKKINIYLDVNINSYFKFKKKYRQHKNIFVITDPVFILPNWIIEKNSTIYKIFNWAKVIVQKKFDVNLYGRRKGWASTMEKKVDIVYYPMHLDKPQHFKKPLITTIHAILPNYDKKIMSIIDEHVAISKCLITSWNYPFQEFKKLYPHKENWFLLPYIALQNVNFSDQKIPFLIENDYFLYVSFFEERKNHINLVYAYEKLNKKYENLPDLIFVGAGDKNYIQHIKNYILNAGLEKKIKIYDNYLASECVSYLYYNCLAVISPTLWEAASGTIVEASYCGKPIISSNVLPLKDFAEFFDLEMIFFEPLDSEDISNKILYFLENRDHFIELSKANSNKIKIYNIEYFGNKLMDIFEVALKDI